jgi:8-oxo-dGTP pyrophosphatase MutT (NUDIX family)
VDASEGGGDAAHRLAGVREVAEEAGVELFDPEALVKFSRWITPPEVRIRFDTHFFLAPVPDDVRARPDGSETVDARWYAPADALEAHVRGEIEMVFPTIRHLEQLGAFATADALLDWAGGREVQPVQPRVLVTGEKARIVLPGEPGYGD